MNKPLIPCHARGRGQTFAWPPARCCWNRDCTHRVRKVGPQSGTTLDVWLVAGKNIAEEIPNAFKIPFGRPNLGTIIFTHILSGGSGNGRVGHK